ncbi:MAG: hypothetical protein OXQ93_14475 [Gemmatimonadota bacterium]|nr:hypothetical protein [Gemmatimonadota bacterium]
MSRLSPPWAVGLLLLVVSPASSQQVVEIDFTGGRTIIDDPWNRDMRVDDLAFDWNRGLFFVTDTEEPNGIMVFSLETGEWLRTVSTPKGEGPYELPYGVHGTGLARNGGLYVNGFLSVVEFDLDGEPVNSWRPLAPPTTDVCDLGGVPAIPTQGGVVRQRLGNADEHIGNVQIKGHLVSAAAHEARNAITRRVRDARIACWGHRAYVVMTYSEGLDSVFVHHLDGSTETITLPSEGIEGMMDCRPWQGLPENPLCPVALHNLQPSFDDRGNLVLLGFDMQVHGVVINPETGCHALIRNTTKLHYIPVGVHADSVAVFHAHVEEMEVDGRTVKAYRDTSGGLSMRPLRRVSGERCPGMLSSVR